MARLNTSVPPSSSFRESSLYRMTPAISHGEGRGYTPTGSDKENQSFADPDEEDTMPPRGKSKAKPSLSRQSRVLGQSLRGTLSSDEEETPRASRVLEASGMEELHFYDPDQNVRKRRKLRQEMLENNRNFALRKASMLQRGNEHIFMDHLQTANLRMREVRQTADATIDSRFLVDAGELALKKAKLVVNGDTSTKIDTDEFVSKCMTFMRNGGALSANEEAPNTQKRRQRRQQDQEQDSDDEDHEDEEFDWSILGARACFQANSRPPLPGFLLGPLSVQKRVRQLTQRRARQEKKNVQEVRPEQLKAQDLQQAENSNLTALCNQIQGHLRKHITTKTQAIEDEMDQSTDTDELLRKYRMAMTEDDSAAVSLFEFITNPDSFAQTVENLFYVSFLIKDGFAQVDYDSSGLPVLLLPAKKPDEKKKSNQTSKQQSIFSIDYGTWQQLISAFNITEPLIPNRSAEGPAPTATGWYS